MKALTLAISLALAATTQAAPMNTTSRKPPTAQAAANHIGDGVLKALNAKDGKVQIAHEPIAELGWPAMTMWFALKTPLPQDLKVGDSVRFELRQQGKEWVITGIERRK